MSSLNTDYYARCIITLEKAFKILTTLTPEDDLYEIYRAACVKEFEIILEQTGKLLKKCLKPYFASSKHVDQLNFKDVFRFAAKHSIISIEEAERWLIYRDNRNDTAHDYGVGFANDTLALLPRFIQDAYAINLVLQKQP